MQFLLVISFFLTLFLIHQSLIRLVGSLHDYIIKFFIFLVAFIIPSGYLLSQFNVINQSWAWAISLPFLAGVSCLVTRHKELIFNLQSSINQEIKSLKSLFHELSLIEKIIFSLLAGTLFFCTIINLIVVFVTIPNEWDSMTGHLVKCAYYLQNGNMNRLDGTTWTIDYYPNSLPTLQIYFYELLQSEKGFKVIHYLAYWIFPIAMYGICRNLGQNKKSAIFVFLLASLLPSTLIQATTTETDLVFTAYLACVIFFLGDTKAQRHKGTKEDLSFIIHNSSFIILSLSVWISHKSTFILVSPALGLVSLYFLKDLSIKKWLILCLMFIGFACIYILPNGYVANLKAEGRLSPSAISAPKSVMAYHSIESFSKTEILKYGTKNIFRYGFDFFNLDGIRNTEIGKNLNDGMRKIPIKFAQKLNLEEQVFWVVNPFYFSPKFAYFKERPYWGVISFLLVLPIIFWFLFEGIRYKGTKALRKKVQPTRSENHISYLISHISYLKPYLFLLLACIIHYLALCFTAHYDPIKGRYFMNMAVWALPFLGLWFATENSNWRNIYLLFCSIFAVSSAFGTILWRTNYPIIAEKGKKNIFDMNRIEMMTTIRPDFYPAYKKADSLIPQNAKLAVALISEDFEYPLFGEHLTRKIIPIKPFNKPIKQIPVEAEYLFFTKGLLPLETEDIQLNQGDITKEDTPMPENVFYLRKLQK